MGQECDDEFLVKVLMVLSLSVQPLVVGNAACGVCVEGENSEHSNLFSWQPTAIIATI